MDEEEIFRSGKVAPLVEDPGVESAGSLRSIEGPPPPASPEASKKDTRGSFRFWKSVLILVVVVAVLSVVVDMVLMFRKKVVSAGLSRAGVNLRSASDFDLRVDIDLYQVRFQSYLHSVVLHKDSRCIVVYERDGLSSGFPVTTVAVLGDVELKSKSRTPIAGDRFSVGVGLVETNFDQINKFMRGDSVLVTPKSAARLKCSLKFSVFAFDLPWALPFHRYDHDEVMYLSAETRAKHANDGGEKPRIRERHVGK